MQDVSYEACIAKEERILENTNIGKMNLNKSLQVAGMEKRWRSRRKVGGVVAMGPEMENLSERRG